MLHRPQRRLRAAFAALRQRLPASIAVCRQALQASGGDLLLAHTLVVDQLVADYRHRTGSGAADAAIGRYSDFDCADWESEEYHDLARRYLELSDNQFMDDDAVAGYGIVTMVAEAVDEMSLQPGMKAVATVKATNVMLEVDE